MALTVKKKAFAQAKYDGADNKQSAIFAGYSPESASQAGSRLAKDPDVIAYIAKLKAGKKLTSKDEKLTSSKPKPSSNVQVVKVEKIESGPEQAHGQFVGRDEIAIGAPEDPLEYLKTVWMNEQEDPKLRLDAAKAAMPYIHGKVADKGKKQTQEEEAHAAAKSGGKFATRAARKANYSQEEK